jgi:hypothetical protein
LVAVIITGAFIYSWDNRRRHPADDQYCTGTLSECFQQNDLKNFTDHQVIDQKEFDDMLNTIYDDLNSKVRTKIDPARADYDTPFFNGNGRGDSTHETKTVCIGKADNCYSQSSINYVAQGMYSAKTKQSLEDTLDLANSWNKRMYGHEANKEELYWMEYGYKYYNSHKKDLKGK